MPRLYARIKDMNNHNCLIYILNVLERKEHLGNQEERQVLETWKERRV